MFDMDYQGPRHLAAHVDEAQVPPRSRQAGRTVGLTCRRRGSPS
jgi:hypothetical protein